MNDYPNASLIVGEMLASDLVGRSHEVYPIGHHVAVKCRFCDHLDHFNTVDSIEMYCAGIVRFGCSMCGIHPDRVPDIVAEDWCGDTIAPTATDQFDQGGVLARDSIASAPTLPGHSWPMLEEYEQHVTHNDGSCLLRRIEGAVLITIGLGMAAVSAIGWVFRRWTR